MSLSESASPPLKKYILLEDSLFDVQLRHSDEEELRAEIEDTLQDIWWHELTDDERTRLDSLKARFKPNNTPIELLAKSLKALQDDDWLIRMQAATWISHNAETLTSKQNENALESLLNTLHDLNPYVRYATLRAIQILSPTSKLLEPLLDDPDERVRNAAVAALRD